MCGIHPERKLIMNASFFSSFLLDCPSKHFYAGVEPIIHDDISTHMSSCVGGSISGVIVIFTGSVLVHQRNRNAPDVKDAAVVIDMLLAFIFCYTLIFTVMEPCRASIKGVYVSFGQHPQSLSQSFPLIFHRLSRMSRSNVQ